MIYIFAGDNGLIRDKEVEGFLKSFNSSYGDMAIESYLAEDLDEINLVETITGLPFLTERRLVKIRGLFKAKNLVKAFLSSMNRISDSTDIVLVEDKLDKNSDTLKMLKVADLRQFNNLNDLELINWALEYVRSKNGQTTKADMRYLIQRVGPKQESLYFELQKLLAYNPTITQDSIDRLTSLNSNSSVFDLLNSIVGGNSKKAIEQYREQNAQGQAPQALLGMITWQLTALAMVRAARDLDPREIASTYGISPFVIRKILPLSKNLTKAKMIEMFEVTIEADIATKNSSAPDNQIIESLILKLIQIIKD